MVQEATLSTPAAAQSSPATAPTRQGHRAASTGAPVTQNLVERRHAGLQFSSLVTSKVPYAPGKPAKPGQIKLSSNENPRGCSPLVMEKLHSLDMEVISRYPDSNCEKFLGALAKFYGIAADHLVATLGSDQLLLHVAKTFLEPGTSTVYSDYSFQTWQIAVQEMKATPIVVPSPSLTVDLDALLAAITPTTRVVYVANPGNPSGTAIASAPMKKFIEAVPGNVAIMLDMAYYEYLPPELKPHLVQWVHEHPNLIVGLTLSKAYGFGGQRLGYCMTGLEIANALRTVRPVFSVPGISEVLALVALSDQEFVTTSVEVNKQCRDKLCGALRDLNVDHLDPETNFVLVRVAGMPFSSGISFKDGNEFAAYAEERDFILRPVGNYGLPEYIRISIGLPWQNDKLIEMFRDLGAVRGESAVTEVRRPLGLPEVVHAPPEMALGLTHVAVVAGSEGVGASISLALWLGQARSRVDLSIVVEPGSVTHYSEQGITVRKDDRQWVMLPRQHPAMVRFVPSLQQVPAEAVVVNPAENDQAGASLAGLQSRHTLYLLRGGRDQVRSVKEQYPGVKVYPGIAHVAADPIEGAVETKGGQIVLGRESGPISHALQRALAGQDVVSVQLRDDMDADRATT